MHNKLRPLHCYLLIVVALVLYPLLYGIHISHAGDTDEYINAANVILQGYYEITFRVPVYPLLLILTGSLHQLSISLFLLQFLLYFFSVWLLVTALLRTQIGKFPIFCITVLLVSPPLVRVVYFAMTEALAFSLVNILFAIFILLKGKYKFALMGLIMAALTLTRPSFQLTGLLLVGLLLLIEKNKLSAFLFFISFAAPVLLFSYFNKVKFNYFGVTPATGWHLTTKTALFIEDWPDVKMRPLMVRQRNDNLINKSSHTGSMFFWSLPPLLEDSLHTNFVGVSKYMMQNNMALIKTHPLDYLSAVGRSIFDYTLPNGIEAKDRGILKALYSAIQLAYMYFALVLTAAVFVCVWLFRNKINASLLYPLLLVYVVIYSNYFASVAAEVGSSRHRSPTEGLILISIAYALPIVSFCRKSILNSVKMHGKDA